MDGTTRRNRDWIVVGVATVVVGEFAQGSSGHARFIWEAVGGVILAACVTVLLNLHVIIKNLRRERKEKKLERAKNVLAMSFATSVHKHGAPAVQFETKLKLPMFPIVGQLVMHPDALNFKGRVEIVDDTCSVVALCPLARNIQGTVFADYPQDFGDAPQRLPPGKYIARWTNLILNVDVGITHFEIDQNLTLARTKVMTKALKKVSRRQRFRKLAELDQ